MLNNYDAFVFLLSFSLALRKWQSNMNEFLQKKDCSPTFAAALTDSVLNMIIKDMRPLSMVEDEGFRAMVNTFQPGYCLPKRTCFTNMMERRYEDEFLKVKLALSSSSSMVSLTTDAWTSIATEAYLGITCHYINNDWDRYYKL